MLNISDIKKRGMEAIYEEINDKGIATLNYKGQPKYVIIDIDEYEKSKELELLLAYQRVKNDIEKGNAEIIKNELDLDNHFSELEKSIKEI